MKENKATSSNKQTQNKPKPSKNGDESDLDENIEELDDNHEFVESRNFQAKTNKAFPPSYITTAHKPGEIKVNINSATTPQVHFTSVPKLSEGRPILLIEKSPFGLNLSQEAIEELSKYDLKTSFVTILGPPKSGKSLLLTKILGLPDKSFQTEHSDGLMMWSVPMFLQKENRLIYFLESPPFTKAEGEDVFFALIAAISSHIIFNLSGEVDESVLPVLFGMAPLREVLKGMNKSNTASFSWVFRDIPEKTLKQVADGNFSQTQMLENKFFEFSRKNKDAKRLLGAIYELFPQKRCFYLAKAVDSSGVANKEFTKSIDNLKMTLEEETPGKILFDTVLNTRMMLTFLNSALETIRETSKIDLAFCWNCIIENESITAYNECLDLYNQLLKEFFKEDEPRKPEEIYQILQSMRDVTFEKFSFVACLKDKNEFYASYQGKVKEIVDGKEMKTIEINEQMNAEKNEMIFKDLERKLQIDLGKGVLNGKNGEDFIKALNDMMETYGNLSKGFSKAEVMVSGLKRVNETILNNFISNLIAMKDSKEKIKESPVYLISSIS